MKYLYSLDLLEKIVFGTDTEKKKILKFSEGVLSKDGEIWVFSLSLLEILQKITFDKKKAFLSEVSHFIDFNIPLNLDLLQASENTDFTDEITILNRLEITSCILHKIDQYSVWGYNGSDYRKLIFEVGKGS